MPDSYDLTKKDEFKDESGLKEHTIEAKLDSSEEEKSVIAEKKEEVREVLQLSDEFIKLINLFKTKDFGRHKRILELDPDKRNKFALVLIEIGEAEEVKNFLALYCGGFKYFDKEVAIKLIENGYADFVSTHLWQFNEIDKEVANKLIEKGYIKSVLENLDIFKLSELDNEFAVLLIEKGYTKYFFKNFEKFEGIDNEVALILIEKGYIKFVIDNINNFARLDKRVAIKLIEKGYTKYVLGIMSHFEIFDKDVVIAIIDNGMSSELFYKLDRFEGLDREVAKKFIEDRRADVVFNNLDLFHGLILDEEIALKLIEYHQGIYVINEIFEFGGYLYEFIDEKDGTVNEKILELVKRNIFIHLTRRDIESQNTKRKLRILEYEDLNLLKGKGYLDKASLETDDEAKKVFEALVSGVPNLEDEEIRKQVELNQETRKIQMERCTIK